MQKNSSDIRIRNEVDRLGRPNVKMLDKEIAWHERRESYIRLTVGALICLTIATAVIIIITNFWVTVLQIDGSSMNPLLKMDQIVIAVKTNEPAKNDVIVFYQNNKLHIKRVIAVQGDWVNIDENGIVSVNGTPLKEPYVSEHSLGVCDIELPFMVQSGTVFVMGDNRPVSIDSRSSEFGSVGKEQILGRVSLRLRPLSRIGKA